MNFKILFLLGMCTFGSFGYCTNAAVGNEEVQNPVLDKAAAHNLLLEMVKNGATEVVVPDYVKEIKDGAFSNCSGFVSVVIPGNVKKIGGSAFQSCRDLQLVTIERGVEEIDDEAFVNCNNLKMVSLNGTVKRIGQFAFSVANENLMFTVTYGLEEADRRRLKEALENYTDSKKIIFIKRVAEDILDILRSPSPLPIDLPK